MILHGRAPRKRIVAEGEKEARYSIRNVIQMFAGGQSFLEAIESAAQTIGIMVLVVVLLLGLLFFTPTIVASMRQIPMRIPICIVNVCVIILFFFNLAVPIIIWLLIMILALTGKREIH